LAFIDLFSQGYSCSQPWADRFNPFGIDATNESFVKCIWHATDNVEEPRRRSLSLSSLARGERMQKNALAYRGGRRMDDKNGPLTPALSPSEGERENRRQVSM